MSSTEILVKYRNKNTVETIKLKPNESVSKKIEELNDNPAVDYAEPNYLYEASLIPSDTYYGEQWYLDKIQAPKSWDIARDASDIVIAVIDSGVQINHPDLKDNIWVNEDEIPNNNIDDDRNGFIDDVNGWDFVNNTASPEPKFKPDFTEAGILHGTIVSGIAAAIGNNKSGVSGIAWKAKIMPLKVLDDAGEGNTGNVVKSIDYAIANGADIINLSFVGFGFSYSLEASIKRAYDAGLIIAAAAGNEQGEGSGYSLDDTPMYPACHDGKNGENMVIGVAATDTLDQKAIFSSHGFKCVDIAAPGTSIFSTLVYSPKHNTPDKVFDKYYGGYWSGTSMATPMVSAAAALIRSANPALGRDEILNILFNNSDNINKLNPNYLNQLGKGRLNIYSSVSAAEKLLLNKKTSLISSLQSDSFGVIKIMDKDGNVEKKISVFKNDFKGGINISSGDINGDGFSEIIASASGGSEPEVKVLDENGTVLKQFFAYNKNFRGGVKLAACDIDQNGSAEIITAPGFGGGPQIRIFDGEGKVRGQFFAYNKNFRGGAEVACGDVDGDGNVEIVTGAGKGGGPHVRIFDAKGKLKSQFFAYNTNFHGGIKISLGEIDGALRNSKQEIIVSPGAGGGPQVRIFDNYGSLLGQFFAYSQNFKGGVNLSAGDINNDGLAEIITGAGQSGSPHVRAFKKDGELLSSFYAFDQKFDGGVNVGVIENIQ